MPCKVIILNCLESNVHLCLNEPIFCCCHETPKARCFIKTNSHHSEFLGLMRTIWPYHRVADGIVMGGGVATGSDHMTRQEASKQEGASLIHNKVPTRTNSAFHKKYCGWRTRTGSWHIKIIMWRKPVCRERLGAFYHLSFMYWIGYWKEEPRK